MSLFFTPPVKKNISECSLFPIATADVLLSSKQRKIIIKNIRQLIDISDEHFDILYQSLINNFVEFVQLLPTNSEDRLGSLIDNGLLRSLFALQLQTNEAENHQPDPLMVYALFSVSLLLDIGFVTNNYTVMISEKDGTFIEEWLPSKGKMQQSNGGYYRIRYGGGMSLELSRKIVLILVQQLMPPAGFNWIAQDQDIFSDWIDIFNNEKEATNDLKSYIDLANKKISNEPQKDFFLEANTGEIIPEETALGEEFIEWLKNELTNKTIGINTYDSNIHVIENGLFLEIPEVINKFCLKSSKNPIFAATLFMQLKKIGFISSNETDDQLAIYVYTDINNLKPVHFMQKLPLSKQNSKNLIRYGVEVLMPCFFLPLLVNNLCPENHFVSAQHIKEKLKKKLKVRKRIKLRRKRLEERIKAIEEFTLSMLNANKERLDAIDATGKIFKKWLEKWKT